MLGIVIVLDNVDQALNYGIKCKSLLFDENKFTFCHASVMGIVPNLFLGQFSNSEYGKADACSLMAYHRMISIFSTVKVLPITLKFLLSLQSSDQRWELICEWQ